MKNNIQSFLAVILLVSVLSTLVNLLINWEIYKYGDCRKVGHTKIYCLFTKS